MPVLVVEDLWKRFSEAGYVLRGVDLTVEEGELALITGPNGSGKTTLLKLIAGLLRPSRGRVAVKGVDPRLPASKRYLGMVCHEPLLYPELTVRENLRYYASLLGLRDPSESRTASEAVRELGLEGYMDRRVEELSYGWRKRADFVRALLGSPALLVADEPFTGLDAEARRRLAGLIRRMLESGSAVVAATPAAEADVELLRRAGVEPKVYIVSEGVLRGYEGVEPG